jgi:hypothetical protein
MKCAGSPERDGGFLRPPLDRVVNGKTAKRPSSNVLISERIAICRYLPSRPGEFHPEPLTDPDVNQLVPSHGSSCSRSARQQLTLINGDDPLPSLHGHHYTRFITTKKQSVPSRRIGTFRSCLFPWHRHVGSHVP